MYVSHCGKCARVGSISCLRGCLCNSYLESRRHPFSPSCSSAGRKVASHAADTTVHAVRAVCPCVAPASHPPNRHQPQGEGAIHRHRDRGSAVSYDLGQQPPAWHHIRDSLYTEYCTVRASAYANRPASHQRQRHVDQPLVSTVRSNRTSYTVSDYHDTTRKPWPRPVRPSPTSKIANRDFWIYERRHQPSGTARGARTSCLSTATHREKIQKNTRPHCEPPSSGDRPYKPDPAAPSAAAIGGAALRQAILLPHAGTSAVPNRALQLNCPLLLPLSSAALRWPTFPSRPDLVQPSLLCILQLGSGLNNNGCCYY